MNVWPRPGGDGSRKWHSHACHHKAETMDESKVAENESGILKLRSFSADSASTVSSNG